MTYPISSTPGVFVDHNSLSQMSSRIAEPGTRAVLVGFGEYSKHLINLHVGNVVGIYDPRGWTHGIKFRGIPVLPSDATVDTNLIIVCEYDLVYEFLGQIVRHYDFVVPYFIPDRFGDKLTDEINVFEQEALYQKLFHDETEVPVSMMIPNKIKLLIEMLRFGLNFPGDVVEMGSWQGGSTWYMASTLALLGETRRLFAMDLFEGHSMDPTATMCTDEIERRLTKAYPRTELIVGLIDDEAGLARIPGKLCFAHIDLGPIPRAMDFVWDRLSVGAPLILDNYGHIRAPTWSFDDFFEERGTRVIRLPWSEQGLVFKR